MHDLVISGAVGVSVGIAWIAIWIAVLHAFDIPVLMLRHGFDWGFGATIFGVVSLVIGFMNGIRSWNSLFRVEVPFPPQYPRQRNWRNIAVTIIDPAIRDFEVR